MNFLRSQQAQSVVALAFVVFSLLDFGLDLWAQISCGELEMANFFPAKPLTIESASRDKDSSSAAFQDEDCFCSTRCLTRERCLLRPQLLCISPLIFCSSGKVLTVDLVPPYHPPRILSRLVLGSRHS